MNKKYIWLAVHWGVFTLIATLVSLIDSDDTFLERLIWGAFGGVVYILLLQAFERWRLRWTSKRK